MSLSPAAWREAAKRCPEYYEAGGSVLFWVAPCGLG